MSRDRSANHIPFGYTFDESASGQSISSYPPPGDRPLLHDEENSFLESFFNNPDNIDPNSLASMPGEYQAEGGAMYGNNSNLDWAHGSTEYPNPPTNPSPNNNGHGQQQDWQITNPGNQSNANEASADVYAAAGILHNNNNNNNNNQASRRQSNNSYNAFPIPTSNSETSQINGYSYPPLNTNSGPGYNFDSSSGQIAHLYELSPRYAQGENTNPYLAGLQNRLGGPNNNAPRPAGPLAFGSDDNFRGTYVAPSGETPDKELEEAAFHNFADNSKAHRQRRPPTAAMRKRARPPVDERSRAEGNYEDASFDEDDGAPKRRRRDEGEDDGEDDYENGTSARGKKGKRKASTIGTLGYTIKDDIGSPGMRGKGSVSAGKTNRENLTEEQKRNNHIQSEQKRRNLIKQGFDDLNRMVPELRSGSLSKSNMLTESARFMKKLRDGNDELRMQLHSLDKG